jgi:hypothetical protein
MSSRVSAERVAAGEANSWGNWLEVWLACEAVAADSMLDTGACAETEAGAFAADCAEASEPVEQENKVTVRMATTVSTMIFFIQSSSLYYVQYKFFS